MVRRRKAGGRVGGRDERTEDLALQRRMQKRMLVCPGGLNKAQVPQKVVVKKG